MRRRTWVLAPIAAALVGCPLPQPLPEYSPGAVTPPRIVVDDSVTQMSSAGTVVPVPAGCTGTAPTFVLGSQLAGSTTPAVTGAQIRDSNTVETIEARWFVNYDPTNSIRAGSVLQDTIAPVVPTPPDPTLRTIQTYTFHPYQVGSATDPTVQGNAVGALHVVELVVSNGFRIDGADPTATWKPGDPLPFRAPAPGFEVQVFRWIFVNVTPSTAPCDPRNLLCAVCPP